MTSVPALNPKSQFLDANGNPLVLGTIDVFLAGTTTRTTSWQDKAQTTPNTNPIILDGRGECLLWLDGSLTYKFVLKNAVGVTQWTVDNISGAAGAASLVSFIQAGTGAVARTAQAKMRETALSVSDYSGCDPTGAAASDAAFVSALTYIASLARAAADGGANLLGNMTLRIPPGTYKLTSSASFLNSALFASRTRGLTIEADGPPGSVMIVYDPTVAGPLMVNNDKLLFLRFKNIWFHGVNNAATSNIMDSTSTGGAQDYHFDDCVFSGAWQFGMNLAGANVNSEMKWTRCMWTGSWTAFLFSAVGASDQFLNYWFLHCKYWTSSPWIDMSKGGSIKLTDCDVSGYSPVAQTYLFNLRGSAHARGVTSFSCKGVRFEQKTQFAGIIYSEWEQGNILFTGCDFSSQASNGFAPTVLSAYFKPGNTAGSIVKFDNCAIMGQHKFEAGLGPVGQGRAEYQNCEFLNYSFPDDAIILADSGQTGRRVTVRMRNCRGNAAAGAFADAEVGWKNSSGATVQRKLVSLRTTFSQLPSAADGTQTAVIPIDAIITRAIIDVPAGATASGSTTAGYTLQTSDGVNLATLALSPFSAGGRVDTTTFVRCTTRATATVQLIPNAGNNTGAGSGSVALVEYIG